MEEKKLTDEEIVKALKICATELVCSQCPYRHKCVESESNDGLLLSALVLINRQKAEIERLAEENRKLGNEWDNTTQYCNRLQYENDNLKEKLRLYKDANEVIKRNAAELQKQVDELKERAKIDLKNEKNWGKIQTKQAVKDTAKEIFGEQKKFICSKWKQYMTENELIEFAEERYGVEVE